MPNKKYKKLKPFKVGQKVKSKYTGAKGTVVRAGKEPVVKYEYKGKLNQKTTKREYWIII